MANVRGELIPYIRLREHFNIPLERGRRSSRSWWSKPRKGRYGFVVDQVLGDCQTVIKNLGRFYRHVQVVSGATILGNGTVALILDPERLAQDAVRTLAHGPRGRPLRLRGRQAGARGKARRRACQSFVGAGAKFASASQIND
jgi:two-component system chemotaxis sensor kinase CheA